MIASRVPEAGRLPRSRHPQQRWHRPALAALHSHIRARRHPCSIDPPDPAFVTCPYCRHDRIVPFFSIPCPVSPATTCLRATYLTHLFYSRCSHLPPPSPVCCLPGPWGASASNLLHPSGRGHVQKCKSGHWPRSLGHPLNSSSRPCPYCPLCDPATSHWPVTEPAPMVARASYNEFARKSAPRRR
jgi:hypothetical protein